MDSMNVREVETIDVSFEKVREKEVHNVTLLNGVES